MRHPQVLAGGSGLAIQLLAGASTVIWPNEKWIAWAFFILGTTILLGSVAWWFFANYRFAWPIKKRVTERSPTPAEDIPGDIEKMPLVDLFKVGKNYGLDFLNNTDLIEKFARALRQAGFDGLLYFWGRANTYEVERLNRGDLLRRIVNTHWAEFRIDGLSAFTLTNDGKISGFVSDNFRVRSYSTGTKNKGYNDLQVQKHQPLSWLQYSAPKILKKQPAR